MLETLSPSLLIIVPCLPLFPLFLVYLLNQHIVDAKRKDLLGLFKRRNVYSAYAEASGVTLQLSPTARERQQSIDQLFARVYNWQLFVPPMIIVAVLTWFLTRAALSHVDVLVPNTGSFSRLLMLVPDSCLQGFAGAYVWVLFQVVLRYRIHDFNPSFAQSLWVGLVTSSLTTGFMGAALGNRYFLLNYALGFLPATEIVSWLQRLGRSKLGIEATTVPSEPATLHHLQGMTHSIVVRLSEENIDSAHQLAYADPLLLLLRTNIPWFMILDLVDQALLFNYLGQRMKLLQPAGIRGAIEFARVLAEDQKGKDNEPLIDRISEKIDIDKLLVRNLVRTLAEDYQIRLVDALFAGSFGLGGSNTATVTCVSCAKTQDVEDLPEQKGDHVCSECGQPLIEEPSPETTATTETSS